VRAALSIRDTLAEQGELEIRIGITTGEALVALADVQGALDDVAKIVPTARSAGDPQQRVPWLSGCAVLLVEAGRTEEARQVAGDLFREGGVMTRWALIDVALVAEELGCIEELTTVIESGPRTKWADAAGAFARGDVVQATDLLNEIGDVELESLARVCARRADS
jgi:hypothetical protein